MSVTGPATIMRGEIESVQDGIRPVDRALVDSLGQETARLTRLVEDLYQLARADIGALEYEFERASLGGEAPRGRVGLLHALREPRELGAREARTERVGIIPSLI